MKVLPFLTSPTICLEIGHSSLKAVDGMDGLELSLERSENGRLTSLCAERLTESLKVFLKKHNWRPHLRAFCAIGARGVSLRRVSLPASPKEELGRLLLLQIEREFPLPPEDLAWGYCRIHDESQPRNGSRAGQELIVVAVKREVLQEYAELLSACGLTPVFTLGALARSSLCLQPPMAYSVLDLGRNHSELISFENGAPSSIRILPWGGDNITRAIEKRLGVPRPEADKIKQHPEFVLDPEVGQHIDADIAAEVELLAGSLQKNGIGQKLYLTGGSARLTDLAPRLAKAMGHDVECERLEFPAGEGSSAAIVGLRRYCQQNGGLPPLVLQTKTLREREKNGAPSNHWKWAGLAALLLVTSFALRYAEATIQKPRLSRKLAELKAYREKLPGMERELGFLQYLKTNQPPYLESIHALANAAPNGMRLETLSINRRGDLSLRGTMRDGQQVVDMRSKLIDSGLFSSVVVDEQTPSSDRQKITVRMSGQWKQPSQGKSLASEAPRQPIEKPKTPSKVVNAPAAAENAATSAPPAIRTASPPGDAKE
jgi:Tfp pilus assembly PilM family ATPase